MNFSDIGLVLLIILVLICACALSYATEKLYAKEARERQSSDDNDGEDRQ